MTDILDRLGELGITLQDHQEEARLDAQKQVESGAWLRLCLYHRTGAGKTIASLVCVAQAGAQQVLVVTPPITHPKWMMVGASLGIEVTAISHAKFRQKGYKVRRDQAIIVDEFHLLGGHTGQGWKKLDAMARGLKAPLVICSATPNYNDAERVYCVQHVLDPAAVKGGYLQFLYDHTRTKVNPFGQVPEVLGFLHHVDAEHYLSSLPHVHYVEDEMIKLVRIGSVDVQVPPVPDAFEEFGLDARRGRIIASQIEERHARARYRHLTDGGLYRPGVYSEIASIAGNSATPVLAFTASSRVGEALYAAAVEWGARARLITGTTKHVTKEKFVQQFIAGELDILIGTASLATGLDGIDKVCDTLLIVDDTDDDAMRRQLMGRILPRGLDTDVSKKEVYRLEFSS